MKTHDFILKSRGTEPVHREVKKLSLSAAKRLSRTEGMLELNGLETIDDKIASALAAHTGTLVLDSLTHIQDTTALSLVPHRGPLSLAGVENPGSIIWSIFLKRGHSPFNQLPPLEAFSIPMSDSVKSPHNLLHQVILHAITPEEFQEELINSEALAKETGKKPGEKTIKPAPRPTPLDDYLAQPLVSLPFDRMQIPKFLKALKLDFEELETLARGRTPCQILVALRQYTQLDIPWPTEFFKDVDLSSAAKLAEIINSSELTGPSTPSTDLELWNCST